MISSFHYAFMAAYVKFGDRGFIDDSQFANYDIMYNVFFVVDLIMQFFIYKPNIGEDEDVKTQLELASEYFFGGFFLDFITVMPLYHIFSGIWKQARILYLIKLVRLYRGIQLLNTSAIMGFLKGLVERHINNIISSGDIEKANDREHDRNYIRHIVLAGHVVRTLKLVIILSSISYLFALIWYIICSTELDFQ